MNHQKDTSKEIEELARHIVPLLLDGGVTEASVFGSFSRGEDKPESDLDLLVRYKENVSLFDVSGLKFELEKLLGIKVDLVSKDYLKPRIKKRILQESVRMVYIDDIRDSIQAIKRYTADLTKEVFSIPLKNRMQFTGVLN